MGPSNRAAFFDVDETLITVKSMFDFFRYWLAQRGDDGNEFMNAVSRLRFMTENGVERAEINRAYYRYYAGVDFSELVKSGRAWYADFRSRSAPFVAATLRAASQHRAAGDTLVLVSGSFQPCLRPLAEELSADVVLCTVPVIAENGLLTGDVRKTMIGKTKAEAVVETIAALGLTPEVCYGYGDHASDVEMLSSVGRPAAVGRDPVLIAHAVRHGWPILPMTPASPAAIEQALPRAIRSISPLSTQR
jgi:HAD superfamily hydrolase (TIGR01490 family)